MIGDDTDIDMDSRLAVGGIVTEVLLVRVEGTERISRASASGNDMKKRMKRSDVQVLHVVRRPGLSCLMLTISTTA